MERLLVSSSGDAVAFDGELRTLHGEAIFEGDRARACAFTGGGVQVGGP